ncbi:4-(cytidine 5'-diphospho)-2-C-methyl-D-erythritol kinase [Reichenbachiella sp. 5M10]|uniref:4-(cytidine 5'-diphospho)-2-C-methyl-D-erythritol kinase n=1 Tax=Reichenbachiella sp. 5M10 TaxID=1889772 RepID=UPI000C14FB59|nr:4-(cytidine 5'-diphospho)-2-C-methyl-D-erythritol kinase [Reichenbachiella sp. 5M10]PIB34244.1 4-(cytidine 5'-diphospho)-2-C-methyl-D-erythritol kinase [Reichenbachiella sp. 5M10]
MIAFPNAKINLGLNILSKRPDGYHNLTSCFVPIDWSDALEVILSDSFAFTSSGLDIPGDASGNLVVQAYELLRADFDLSPVHFHLHKVIPMGAGLGGGSSDGAFALRLLNDLFVLDLDVDRLQAYAKKLGADCPFFVENKTQLVSGIGDVMEEIAVDLSAYQLAVLYPPVHIHTGQAFGGITPRIPAELPRDILSGPIEQWREVLVNDFETPVFAMHPVLAEIKEEFYRQGAHYASLSGSGSSIYGLFAKGHELQWPQVDGALHFVHQF